MNESTPLSISSSNNNNNNNNNILNILNSCRLEKVFYLKTQKKFSLAREWFWPFKSINAPPLVWIESVNMITHRYYCELILLCLCVFKIPNPTIYQVWKIKQRSVIIAYIHTRLSRWCQLPFRFPARAW